MGTTCCEPEKDITEEYINAIKQNNGYIISDYKTNSNIFSFLPCTKNESIIFEVKDNPLIEYSFNIYELLLKIINNVDIYL